MAPAAALSAIARTADGSALLVLFCCRRRCQFKYAGQRLPEECLQAEELEPSWLRWNLIAERPQYRTTLNFKEHSHAMNPNNSDFDGAGSRLCSFSRGFRIWPQKRSLLTTKNTFTGANYISKFPTFPNGRKVSEGGSCANWPGGQGPAGPVSAPGLISNCNLPEWVICFEARAGRIRRFTAAGRHRLCLVAPEAPLVVQEG